MTDDIEWVPMMDYKLDGRGPQNVLEGMLIPAMTEWVTFTLKPSEFVAESERVVSIGRFHSTHRATGKIARFRQYIDTAKIEAARRP